MTFKTFPLSSDLVSFIDGHYAGIAGAHKMLLAISPKIHRLDAGDNTLGTAGALALFEGLATHRRRFSAAGELWGMSDINLARNDIGDEGLMAAAYYVCKDMAMRGLKVQDNGITLETVASAVVERINASRLQNLNLQANPLSLSAMSTFFGALDAPNLRELHLSTCALGPEIVPSPVAYLRSPRSQRLAVLQLNMNSLGRRAVVAIVDAIEVGNWSIRRIGLHANDASPARTDDDDSPPPKDPDDELDPADPQSMETQIERRIPALQRRNHVLTERVRGSAARAVGAARIIFHARPPSPEEIARRVLDDTQLDPTSTTPEQFPLLDLPAEVQILIARHCGGDAYAMSDAQWARVRAHAEDRATLANMARRTRRQQDMAQGDGEARRYKMWEVRDEWLQERACEAWELENARYWERFGDE